jgi:hypothetical protein
MQNTESGIGVQKICQTNQSGELFAAHCVRFGIQTCVF